MTDSSEAIAIVGMALRFPGAADSASFWHNLENGIISIARFTTDQLLASGIAAEDISDPKYVPAKPILDAVDEFDAQFFGFSDRDAALTDPQQRIFLETAWEAFEDAGYDPGHELGRIGVFAAMGKNSYLVNNLLPEADWVRSPEVFQLLMGNEKDYLATRVAHALDARGPALNVQSACSSSLVAIHLACQSLLAGECDFALAGGVTIDAPVVAGYWHHPRGILSPDGQCRPFTPAAAGTVFGHGSAAVVLRRHGDARRDTVRALIRGSAVNNDGKRSSFSAPAESGQTAVVAEALAVARVAPSALGYIETHGTATYLGDAIEVRALERSLRGAAAHQVAVGAVKANIGHAGAAAGIAGFCKTILARQHGLIPPQPHAPPGDVSLGENGSPLFLNSRLRPWPATASCAGVSSFGQGGTNAHVVVDVAPIPAVTTDDKRNYPFMLSARSPGELDDVTDRFLHHLATEICSLADVAWTLFAGRRAFEYRRVIVGCTREEVRRALQNRDQTRISDARVPSKSPLLELVLLPPDRAPENDFLLYPEYLAALNEGVQREENITEASLAQFAIAKLWLTWGIRPESVRGIGTGEMTASLIRTVLLVSHRALSPQDEFLTLFLTPPGRPEGMLTGNSLIDGMQPGLLASLFGQLWLAGVTLNRNSSLFPATARRVPLPTYPFRRRSHWISAQSRNRITESKPIVSRRTDLESSVRSIFCRALGQVQIDPSDDFFALGGTSLAGLTVIAELEKMLGIKLEGNILFNNPTPALLAAALRPSQNLAEDDEELARADIESYYPGPVANPGSARGVFLTGATGLLGIHLLETLLASTTMHVTCLVRGRSAEECRMRLLQTVDRFRVSIDIGSPRLRIVSGDTARRQLGLNDGDWHRIVSECNAVIHSAAQVNLVQAYRAMRDTNVLGLAEVMKLADAGGMALHLASSVAVFECETFRNRPLVWEDDDLSNNRGYVNGYDLAKWAGEQMAMRRPSPTYLHRLSNISPHTRHGVVAPNQILVEFLRACLSLGFAPGEEDRINVIPVDIAAAWMVQLAMHSPPSGSFHVVHPRALQTREVINWLIRRGHPLVFCPEIQWRERVRRAPDNPFQQFLPLLDQRQLFSNRAFDMSRIQSVLGDEAISACPTIDAGLFERYYPAVIAK